MTRCDSSLELVGRVAVAEQLSLVEELAKRSREVHRRTVLRLGAKDLRGGSDPLHLNVKAIRLTGGKARHDRPLRIEDTSTFGKRQKLRTAAGVRRIGDTAVSLEERLHVAAGARETLAERRGTDLEHRGSLFTAELQ